MEEPQPAAANAGLIHVLATLPVAAVFCLFLGRLTLTPEPAVNFTWLLPWLIALAALSTLTALARQLQWQYVLTAASICAVWGGVAQAFSADSGIPFGPFTFGPDAGPQFFNRLPWTVPVLWLVVLFNSRGVGRLILRPWRKLKTYGFWLIGFTVVLSGLFDLGMDPFLSRWQHYWLWSPTELPGDVGGRAADQFPGLDVRDVADPGVCHAGADQKAAGVQGPPPIIIRWCCGWGAWCCLPWWRAGRGCGRRLGWMSSPWRWPPWRRCAGGGGDDPTRLQAPGKTPSSRPAHNIVCNTL